MTSAIKCPVCNETHEVDVEKDIVLCRTPGCGVVLYKRISDYVREHLRTDMRKHLREHEVTG